MTGISFFFNGWGVLWRTLISGLCAYIAMVLLLRRSGKHTLSQMTPFDMIVPLTLGPILASMILLPNVALIQGLFAFGLLVALHSFVAWLSMRSERVRQWIEPEPTLLLHRGVFLKEAMRRERVTESEILEAVRAEGLSSITEAEAVVLEADGNYNVIRQNESKEVTSLEDVSGYPE
ncbi:MAG: DUF421 domain-containing protein [Anaerolineales bacterium]|jgi:uncharacterized membrane protein YcaP (DUF421 family)